MQVFQLQRHDFSTFVYAKPNPSNVQSRTSKRTLSPFVKMCIKFKNVNVTNPINTGNAFRNVPGNLGGINFGNDTIFHALSQKHITVKQHVNNRCDC